MTLIDMPLTSAAVVTRSEYLKASAAEGVDTAVAISQAHRQYYAQFVTPSTRSHVERRFGAAELAQALTRGPHLNTIPMRHWDALCWAPVKQSGVFVGLLPIDKDAIARAGETVTRAVLVCIAKEAARQIIDTHTAKKATPHV